MGFLPLGLYDLSVPPFCLTHKQLLYCSSSSLMKELSALNNLQVIEVMPLEKYRGLRGTVDGAVSRRAAATLCAALPREGRALPAGRAVSKPLVWDTSVSAGLRYHSRMCFPSFPCPPYLV